MIPGAASPATDPAGLAEAVLPSAAAYEAMTPPVKTIAEGTPYAVPAAKSTSAGYAPSVLACKYSQHLAKLHS